MSRPLSILLLLIVLGWPSYWLVLKFDIFASIPQVRIYPAAIGLLITALTLVMLLGKFILNVVLAEMFRLDVTGLTQVITYIAISFLMGGMLLDLLGFNVRTLLTTSALIGAGLAFAMRSSLDSIMSGIALSSEPMLKKGSGILFDGQMLIIERMNWRHVVARCANSSFVLIPNTKMADQSITVYPSDGPVEFEVDLSVMAAVPPQQVSDLLTDAFADIEHLDQSRSVIVLPVDLHSGAGDTNGYRLRLYARYFLHVDNLRGEVLRRAWYVLHRAGLYAPLKDDLAIDDLVQQASPGMPPEMRATLSASGRSYRFAPSELLRFPAGDAGRSILIVTGQAVPAPDQYITMYATGPKAAALLPKMVGERPSTIAGLRRVTSVLAREVGPMAEQLMRAAVRSAGDSDEIIDRLAKHFPEGVARDTFRRDLHGLIRATGQRGPGTICALTTDAVGRVMPDPELRAVSEVLVLSFPYKTQALRAAE